MRRVREVEEGEETTLKEEENAVMSSQCFIDCTKEENYRRIQL